MLEPTNQRRARVCYGRMKESVDHHPAIRLWWCGEDVGTHKRSRRIQLALRTRKPVPATAVIYVVFGNRKEGR